MKIFSLAEGLISLAACLSSLAQAKPYEPQVSRVLDGKPAVPGQFPFQVSIWKDGDSDGNLGYFSCSGVIVTPLWILTAAHCLVSVERGQRISIVAGDIYSDGEIKDGQEVRVSQKWFIHENFDSKHEYNDIGLILLNTPLKRSSLVKAARLPSGYAEYTGQVVVSGWGATKIPDISAMLLYTDSLSIVSTDKCRNQSIWNDLIDSQMCAVPIHSDIQADACAGDSGGPLTQIDKTGESIVLGIVSYGQRCSSNVTTPGVYTKVSFFIQWIRNKIYEYELANKN